MKHSDFQAWAIRPAGLDAARTACAQAADPKAAMAGAVWLGDDDHAAHNLFDIVNGVAIIPVCGTLVPDAWWVGARWITGYNVLKLQLALAFADPEVRGICLDVDSPGGLCKGLFDFVDWFREAKLAAGKPVAAILSEYAYSAAYAIASVADQISVPRTGGVGSIGTVMVHWDISGWLEKVGDKPTIIASGMRKADGNSYGPLPDDVLQEFKESVEELTLLFAETVVENRKTTGVKLDLTTVLATESRAYEGPKGTRHALELGLCDVIAAPHIAFQAFAAFVANVKAT